MENETRNIAIIGTARSGKTLYYVPKIIRQTVLGNTAGCTCILNGIDDAYFIVAVLKRMQKKNKLLFIKPSNNPKVYHELVNDEAYDFDRINDFFNYALAIKNKDIVVIDVEEYKYGDLAKKLMNKLFLHMWLSIQDEATLRRNHTLVIDTADNYLQNIENIMKTGKYFNFTTISMLTSRHYLTPENKRILDTLMDTRVCLNLIKEDSVYYGLDRDVKSLSYRYETFNKMIRCDGTGTLDGCPTDKEMESLFESAKRLKKDDLVADNGVHIENLIRNFNTENYPSYTPKTINPEEEQQEYQEVIVKAIIKAKEPYNGEHFTFTPTEAQKKHIDHVLSQKMPVQKPKQEPPVERIEKTEKIEKKSEVKEVEAVTKKEPNKPQKEKPVKKTEIIEDDDNDGDITVKITRKEEIPTGFDAEIEQTIEKMAEHSANQDESIFIDDEVEEVILPEDGIESSKTVLDEGEDFINTENTIEDASEKFTELTEVKDQPVPGTTFLDIDQLLEDEDDE